MSALDLERTLLQASEQEWVDSVIEAYKVDVDRTLLREALRMTPHQRLQRLEKLCAFAEELRRAGENARSSAR
jgi:hypothetical protein